MPSTRCPGCDTRINYLAQSVGTLKRCEWCGFKFHLPVPAREAGPIVHVHSPPNWASVAIIGIVVVCVMLLCGGFLLFVALTPRTPTTTSTAADTLPRASEKSGWIDSSSNSIIKANDKSVESAKARRGLEWPGADSAVA